MDCKYTRVTSKTDQKLTDDLLGNVDDINVPITEENLEIMALVDGGANFSSLDQTFCVENKIPYVKYGDPETIILADTDVNDYIYGNTEPLTIFYISKTYTAQLDVMRLNRYRGLTKDFAIA
ncbi:hypothetical protein [Absidia glauca]|uniref:Peptidase A2 domain-containing protein n=1 Tax=Absidia glauca TaxID=4829 RepID=A0A163JP98_ABSGL|nr:hypothetical protein [Absidia glauca]